MAETENQAEPTLHAKRKPDLLPEDEEVNAKKVQKLQTLNDNASPVAAENGKNGDDCEENNPKPENSSVSEAKIDQREPELAAEPEDEDEEDYEEDNEDEDEEDGKDSNGKAAVDRKGKGIARDDKGKGKLIEEDSDDDSDSEDDSDSGESEDESDLSDDPLAEVDLDNILPSRTRRRAAQPGFSIGNDRRNSHT